MSAAALEHLHSCARVSFCADASPPRCRLRRIEGHYTGRATAGSNAAPDADGACRLRPRLLPFAPADFKAVVTNNKNVYVMRDIACADYVAGCNTKFFATDRTAGGEATLSVCKENMMKRLAFADDVGAPYASMLAFPAAAGQFINGALDTVMCAAAAASRPSLFFWTARSRAFFLLRAPPGRSRRGCCPGRFSRPRARTRTTPSPVARPCTSCTPTPSSCTRSTLART